MGYLALFIGGLILGFFCVNEKKKVVAVEYPFPTPDDRTVSDYAALADKRRRWYQVNVLDNKQVNTVIVLEQSANTKQWEVEYTPADPDEDKTELVIQVTGIPEVYENGPVRSLKLTFKNMGAVTPMDIYQALYEWDPALRELPKLYTCGMKFEVIK